MRWVFGALSHPPRRKRPSADAFGISGADRRATTGMVKPNQGQRIKGDAPVKISGVFRNATAIREVPAGSVIFREGDPGEEMFGVMEGEVEITTSHGGVRLLGPDETFGEMSIVDSSPRSATAQAVTDTKLAIVDRRTFLFLVHETPMFALQVMSNIAERLRSST